MSLNSEDQSEEQSFEQFVHEKACIVYSTLGANQPESAYQMALVYEMRSHSLINEWPVQYTTELSYPILYKGVEVSTRRVDIFVWLKGVPYAILETKHTRESHNFSVGAISQLKCYMHDLHVDLGILINFPKDACFPSVPDGFT